MPIRAPVICPYCAGIHAANERCPTAKQWKRERKAYFDSQRPGARVRGYDSDWQKLRNAFLAAHPVCCMCGAPAQVADHIKRVRDAPERRLDPSNLQALCRHCHNSLKQREEKRHLRSN